MNQAIQRAAGLILVLAAISTVAGCVRVREPAAPPPPSGVLREEGARQDELDEAPTCPASEADATSAKMKLDPSKVLAVQMQALESQRKVPPDRGKSKVNNFTKWLDRTHETWFCRMDNWVRSFDTLWAPEGTDYDYEVSTFRLNCYMRAGGRGSEKDFEAKVRFNARLALPALEKKLYLFIDNTGRDSLPGADPLEKESDTRLGLRRVWQSIRDSELDLGGGLRLRSSGPVVYGDLEWRWRKKWLGGRFDFAPSGFYYSDDGFGQMTTAVWTRPLGETLAIQLRLAERSTEGTEGLEFEQTARLAWYRPGRTRGWVLQGSLFPHLKSSELYWDNALLNVTYRNSLYKNWIYFNLTPQLDFAREDDYKARASLRMGLQILFGAKPAELM